MKKLATLCIVFLISNFSIIAQSETCDCKTDLDFIISKMEKMPSYKKQIKGEKKVEFEKTYPELSSKMTNQIPVEDCYKLLLKQMVLVKDVHASLGFKNSKILTRNHPKTNKDISQLEAELKIKPNYDLEGIYNFNQNQKIGIYYADNKKDLIATVLKSEDDNWDIGDIHFYATHTNEDKYNLYYYNAETKMPGFVRSLTFENGRIWSYKKVGNTNNFELPDTDETATFKQIDSNIQYLSFKNFSNSNFKYLKKFYKETKDKLTADHIIVDLRGNSGGNSKLSDPFLKDLKNKNVYVITNCFAGSNGEQFTVKLLKNKKAIHLGQKTRGIIAYGFNYGTGYDTPSGFFRIRPTDMNFHNQYFEFEGKGITPEILLDFDKDWIAQTLDIIKMGNK